VVDLQKVGVVGDGFYKVIAEEGVYLVWDW
jgi:hypothetical protein